MCCRATLYCAGGARRIVRSMSKHPTFAGKSILVTGASAGIGEAAAVAFAQAGGRVYSLSRTQPRAAELHWLEGDVARAGAAKAAVERVLADSGRLDVLVNNAGVFEFAPLAASSEAMIRRQLEVNVVGLVLATQAALPALVASKGQILNLSSAAGHKAVPNGSIYAMTKAAVESLTRSWALELAPQGVRVNAVAPGPTQTRGFAAMPVPADAFVAQVPLARLATAEEVAAWIARVADPSATWLTGEILRIDGGMSL